MEHENCPASTDIKSPQVSARIWRAVSNIVVRTLRECGSIEQQIELQKSKF